MNVYREEVRSFISAAETLLSPISSGAALTPEECEVIKFYLETLSGHCAESTPQSAKQQTPTTA